MMATGLKCQPECIPCALRQVLSTARRVSDDEWLHAKILKHVMSEMADADLSRSPAEVSFDALRAAAKLLGRQDPFAEDKRRYNAMVKELLPDLRRRVAESSDPVGLAARLAIAGNIIDLGILSGVDAKVEIERALGRELAIDDTGAFREAARTAKSIFYILDNAGEVVLDRLLIEQLVKARRTASPQRTAGSQSSQRANGWRENTPSETSVPSVAKAVDPVAKPLRKQVTCLVRTAPILNDVTASDAEEVGLDELSAVRDPGAPMLGFVTGLAEPEIRELYEKADLVIAKGQANFETLYDADREVFFFLRAKCPVVAKALGCPEGASVLFRHEGTINRD